MLTRNCKTAADNLRMILFPATKIRLRKAISRCTLTLGSTFCKSPTGGSCTGCKSSHRYAVRLKLMHPSYMILSCPNLGIKSLKSSIRRQYISVTPLVGHLQTEGQINTQQLQRSLLRPLGWRLELPVENRNATREQGRLQFRRLL